MIWAGLGTFEQTIDQMMVLVNAHLAMHHHNSLAVIGTTSTSSRLLYPPPSLASVSDRDSVGAASLPGMTGTLSTAAESALPVGSTTLSKKPANVYKQFFDVDTHIVEQLRRLVLADVSAAPKPYEPSKIAGALSLALTYINKMQSSTTPDRQSRILVLSVSPDGSAQYIPIMNAIFAAQKQDTPIDVCRLVNEPSIFLPQASYITNGIYLQVRNTSHLIQHLIHIFLPDSSTRKMLCLGSNADVDFRASCFCHKKDRTLNWRVQSLLAGKTCSAVLSRQTLCSNALTSIGHTVYNCRSRQLQTSSTQDNSADHQTPVNPPSKVWLQSPRIEEYAAKSLNLVTLQYLLRLGRERDIRGLAEVVLYELPIRLARRVRAIQNLPFIVGVNPWIRDVYELYLDSFEQLSLLPEPKTDEDLNKLATTLAELTESHKTVVPKLANGFMECGKYMEKDRAREFLDGMIHSRIGTRVIAEHYLALQKEHEGWIGVVNTQVFPATILRSTSSYVQEVCQYNYGSYAEFEIIGDVNTKIAYIPVHMEYIFMELIKNAMRATVEFSQKSGRLVHPPVEIAIAQSENDVIIRIRDAGGGITKENVKRVWEYSFTTVPKYDDDEVGGIFSTQARMQMEQGVGGPIAGLGFGLPMSRIYAKYFGGSLEFKTVFGHGTDLFVRFPNISQLESTIS
ncbi:hypothetical protein QVD99_006034 [Batrachochytrium dendrobatidis]|nr:hypothetical protein QVD99_006034 [Batrachochytrium dendrobatidis]